MTGLFRAGIFKQSMGARNRVRIHSQLHSLAELVPWNRFLGSGQFRDQKSLDLHEKSLDLTNYEIFPHKILKSRTFKKSSILIVLKIRVHRRRCWYGSSQKVSKRSTGRVVFFFQFSWVAGLCSLPVGHRGTNPTVTLITRQLILNIKY